MSIKDYIDKLPPLPVCSTIAEAEAEAVKKYPIYTLKNVNPETGRPHCPADITFIKLARTAFVKRIIHAFSITQK